MNSKIRDIVINRVMASYNKNPDYTLSVLEKNVSPEYKPFIKSLRSKTVKADKIRAAVSAVMREYSPATLSWIIKKGLDPGLKKGDIVTYGQGSNKGIILNLGTIGAVVKSLNHGVIYTVNGADIKKVS